MLRRRNKKPPLSAVFIVIIVKDIFELFFSTSEVVLLWFHSYCLHMKGSTEALSPTVTKGKLRVVFVFMLLLMFVVCALCFCLLSLLDVKTKLSMLMILSPVWIQKFLTCA